MFEVKLKRVPKYVLPHVALWWSYCSNINILGSFSLTSKVETWI